MAVRRPDEYRELYKDLNQVSERLILQKVEFSEVMVIHRMYLKLEELDLGHLEGAERVKRLYVFADVVEMGQGEGTEPIARLPGSVFVAIICRILWLPWRQNANESFIALPYIKLHVIESNSRFNLNVYNTSSTDADNAPDFAVCIHAGELKFPNFNGLGATGQLFSILSPNRSGSSANTLDGKNIVFSSDVQTIMNQPILHFPVYTRAIRHTYQGPGLYSISPASLATVGCTVRYEGNGQMSLLSGQTLGPAFWVVRGIPDILFMDDEILLAMNTSLLIAELTELAHPSVDTRVAVAEHVEWLGTILIEASSKTEGTAFHKEYLALSFRAQYLLKTARSTRSLVVPQLQYDIYSPLINRMVQLAQVYDNALTQFKLFIAQNQILGSYLLEQNRAFAMREQDMEAFYSELISQKKSELDSNLMKMDQLGAQMDIQTEDMKQAEADMNAGKASHKVFDEKQGIFFIKFNFTTPTHKLDGLELGRSVYD